MVYKEWPRSHRTSSPNSPRDDTHVHAVYHGTCCDTPRAMLGRVAVFHRPLTKKSRNLLRCSVPAQADMGSFTRIFVYLRRPRQRSRYSDSERVGKSGIESRWRRDFQNPSRPTLGGLSSLLYNGYRVCSPEIKRPRCNVEHPSHRAPSLKEEWSYMLPFWIFMACSRVNLTC